MAECVRIGMGGYDMLGGSFWVSLLRNGIGALLMMSSFLMLDRPRFSVKKTVLCYILFGLLMAAAFSAWYVADGESFVRYSGFMAFLVIGVFCALLSADGLNMALYKISLAFYLLSVCVFCGIDISRWLFDGNLWADIIVRFLVMCVALAGVRRFQAFYLKNVDFLQDEMDFFSVATLTVSFILAALVAYLPSNRFFSVYSMLRMLVILFMAGLIQYLSFHLYIHLGWMHCYQAEKQLMEMNEHFLCRQLEQERKAQEEAARIRHDVRHHCMVLGEYVKKGDTIGMLSYLKQYGEDVENTAPKHICDNRSVDGILSAYAGYAAREKIRVDMDVTAAENLPVRDIDLVAILANIFENAIQGCLASQKEEPEIQIHMARKGHKIVIQCRNTSAENIRFRNGLPQAERGGGTGVSSIVKTAARYEGETDFLVENGMFVARVLLNLSE